MLGGGRKMAAQPKARDNQAGEQAVTLKWSLMVMDSGGRRAERERENRCPLEALPSKTPNEPYYMNARWYMIYPGIL